MDGTFHVHRLGKRRDGSLASTRGSKRTVPFASLEQGVSLIGGEEIV
ncbi:hypothetical protein DSOL_1946 [Desulfosporosinus metallidurans]|uniref:Uncharacterized protein n=1 Tax=Desulfosporosinus metallidurans TaxID=1888891 RepID=A0A1Q8QXM5_9FIRM|nr:hypothetical protein DSOL_1946 [Desulfosporosinus metallidurans]